MKKVYTIWYKESVDMEYALVAYTAKEFASDAAALSYIRREYETNCLHTFAPKEFYIIPKYKFE